MSMRKLDLVTHGSAIVATFVIVASAAAQTAPPPSPAEQAAPAPVTAAPTTATPPLDAVPPAKLGAQNPTLPATEVPPAATATPEREQAPSDEEPAPWGDGEVTLSGYVEAYYSWNFKEPENRITANRWLDERHNTFTLQTVALDIAASKGPVSAKVTLMFGPTADRWYFEGAQIPSDETNPYLNFGKYSNETWKHIQTAYAAYVAPLGRGLTIQGGLMPTQVGFEGAAVKDNWNYSRSNLFNFLPFFHVGGRLAYPLTDALTVSASVYNGYNQATDANRSKTVSLQLSFLADEILLNVLYLGGIERTKGAAEGEPWRNLFDAVLQYDVLPALSLGANVDGGFERTDFGTQSWVAAALYARLKATQWLYFALRGDGIVEQNAERDGVPAAILLGGAEHIMSGTVTAEVRPIEGVSFRLEYRHDDTNDGSPLSFYRNGVREGAQRTTSVQNTLTLGMTGWF
jgi:hypothetical protein